jgi:hypothetical protein
MKVLASKFVQCPKVICQYQLHQNISNHVSV